MSDKKSKKSKLEIIKEESDYLRGSLFTEVDNGLDHFSKDAVQLLKFHGSYQQDDRDLRNGANRHFMLMVRAKLPGGRLTPDQYLVFDRIADRFGCGNFRITTRQSIQLHGILKKDMRHSLKYLNEALVTTLGACGDVVRNVMCSPVPDTDGRQDQIQQYAKELSDALSPATGAYHEIWLDGEKKTEFGSYPEDQEPLYGKSYLPRKFKIGIALPGDNSIDLYTQDIGLVPFFDTANLIAGFNFVVGGGMGMNHNKPETFPRLGDHLGYVPFDDTLETVKAIISIQKEFGDRSNRKHARMKYLIDEWGIDLFRKEVEKRANHDLEPFKPMPPFESDLYLGWHLQSNGQWFIGLSVENGRVIDQNGSQLKSALKKIVRLYKPHVRLTPNQNLILNDIDEGHKTAIIEILHAYGVLLPDELSNVLKYSMACPALPTCGLAIAESERVFPDLIRKIGQLLELLGLQDEKISVRMTGCPNGCARPYVADIGIVGRSLNKYTIFVGGNPAGTRINKIYRDLVPLEDIVDVLRPLFVHFRDNRLDDESFSNFWERNGIEFLDEVTEV